MCFEKHFLLLIACLWVMSFEVEAEITSTTRCKDESSFAVRTCEIPCLEATQDWSTDLDFIQLLKFGSLTYEDILENVEHDISDNAVPVTSITPLTTADKFGHFLTTYDSKTKILQIFPSERTSSAPHAVASVASSAVALMAWTTGYLLSPSWFFLAPQPVEAQNTERFKVSVSLPAGMCLEQNSQSSGFQKVVLTVVSCGECAIPCPEQEIHQGLCAEAVRKGDGQTCVSCEEFADFSWTPHIETVCGNETVSASPTASVALSTTPTASAELTNNASGTTSPSPQSPSTTTSTTSTHSPSPSPTSGSANSTSPSVSSSATASITSSASTSSSVTLSVTVSPSVGLSSSVSASPSSSTSPTSSTTPSPSPSVSLSPSPNYSKAQLVQSIPTKGANDWESFVVGGVTYVAVANHRDGSTNTLVDSVLHRFNESAVSNGGSDVLVEAQSIPTKGAFDWESFVVGGVTCVAVANGYDGSTFLVDSVLYRFNESAVASGGSDVLVEAQSIPTKGALDWESFVVDDVTYVAVANQRDSSANTLVDSVLYRFNESAVANGGSAVLVEVQSIPTKGALDWESFVVGGVTHVAVANVRDSKTNTLVDSVLYRFNESAVASGGSDVLVAVQNIATKGATDWESFVVGGVTHVAVANIRDSSTNFLVDSVLHRFKESAEEETLGEVEFAEPLVGLGEGEWVEVVLVVVLGDCGDGDVVPDALLVSSAEAVGVVLSATEAVGLAVANVRDSKTNTLVDSVLYRFNESAVASGGSDVLVAVQSIPTKGAMDWESFVVGGVTYVAVANWCDDSTDSFLVDSVLCMISVSSSALGSITSSASTSSSVTLSVTVSPSVGLSSSVSASPSSSTSPTSSTTPSPSPSPTRSLANSPSPSVSSSLTSSITSSPTSSSSVSTSVFPSPSNSISITRSVSVSLTPSTSPTVSNSPSTTATPSITPTMSITPSKTPTVSLTPSVSVSSSISPTVSPSPSPSRWITQEYLDALVPPITGYGSGGDGFDSVALVEYVGSLSSISEQSFEVVAYTHSLSPVPVSNAYFGAVYAPTLNRIYFVPYGQAPRANWHHIDCPQGGAVVEYTHSLTTLPVNLAYSGGVYAPTLDRIYFVPRSQANEAGKNWHCIDCAQGGEVVEYTHSLTTLPVNGAYSGGVYAPTLDRIYFVPYYQANEAGKNWHYIDCAQGGEVVEYTHTLTTLPDNDAYYGGVYAPTLDRIYFVPYGQALAGSSRAHHIIHNITYTYI